MAKPSSNNLREEFLLQISFFKPSKHTQIRSLTLRSTCPPHYWVYLKEMAVNQVLASEFLVPRQDFIASRQTSSQRVAGMLSQTMIPPKYLKSESLIAGIINSVCPFAKCYSPKIFVYVFELEDEDREWIGFTTAPNNTYSEEFILHAAEKFNLGGQVSPKLPPGHAATMINMKLRLSFRIQKESSHGPDKTNCTICLDELSDGEVVSYLACSHIYHEHCLQQCLDMAGTRCPICQFEMCIRAVLFADSTSTTICSSIEDNCSLLAAARIG